MQKSGLEWLHRLAQDVGFDVAGAPDEGKTSPHGAEGPVRLPHLG